MGLEETGINLVVIIMTVGVFLSAIPFVPGPVLVWALGASYAFLDGFDRITPAATVIMSIFMIASITSDFWLTPLGVKAQGGSCLSAVGTAVGGLIGTFAIPIPVVGTLVGGVAGAGLVEMVRIRNVHIALRASRAAFMMFIVGMIVEVGLSALILVVFVISAWSTTPV